MLAPNSESQSPKPINVFAMKVRIDPRQPCLEGRNSDGEGFECVSIGFFLPRGLAKNVHFFGIDATCLVSPNAAQAPMWQARRVSDFIYRLRDPSASAYRPGNIFEQLSGFSDGTHTNNLCRARG